MSNLATLNANPDGTTTDRSIIVVPARGERRRRLTFEPFGKVHARFSQLDQDDRHVIDATALPNGVSQALLDAFRAGRLAVTH